MLAVLVGAAMTRTGFTGTSAGMTDAQAGRLLQLILEEQLDGWLHHGDCRGADTEAHGIARECGLRVAIHPPVEDTRRAWCEGDELHMRKPYRARNWDIVNETERLIAAPACAAETQQCETWESVRYARSIGRRVVLVLPDGRLG